jgi:hypothetical protein
LFTSRLLQLGTEAPVEVLVDIPHRAGPSGSSQLTPEPGEPRRPSPGISSTAAVAGLFNRTGAALRIIEQRILREQLPVSTDPERGASVGEKVPQQHLIRLEDRSTDRDLQRLDCSRGSEAVPSDEDRFRIIRDVPGRPFAHGTGLDPTRIPWEVGLLSGLIQNLR